MKATTISCFVFLALFVIEGNAFERGPVTVSPGSESGVAVVGQNCPTFSWSGVEWAASYKVEVFEAVSTEALGYEEMEALSSPVLSKEIQCRALSWTPSSDEQLSTGGMYVWYVKAVDDYGMGMWSVGKVFKVEVAPWLGLSGMGDKVREALKKYGVSEEVIDDVLKDMKSEVKEAIVLGVDTQDIKGKTQDRIGIQGFEGTYNTFYGNNAGFSITTGLYDTFFGANAGYANTSGDKNTFIGFDAGRTNTSGAYNTFLGYEAGYSTTTGVGNTFLGYEAGYSTTIGGYNTFLGHGAGYSNTTATGNIFLGYEAGYFTTTGGYNTFLGDRAGYTNTTGYENTFLGLYAGYSNTTGVQNVFLGSHAGYNEDGSNRLYIANNGTAYPLIYGEFDNKILTIHGKLGVGTKSPTAPMELETTGENASFVLERTDGATIYFDAKANNVNFGSLTPHKVKFMVGGDIKMTLRENDSLRMKNGAACTSGGVWMNASSKRLKENIHDLTVGEAKDVLSGLNPVKYNYKKNKEEKHVGFIAEEVPDLVATNERKGLSPMDIVAVLTKVVQEQQETIDELRGRIAEMERKPQTEK